MDTILGYLESMFATLPDTPELLKARRELGQMMEDKYSELIAKGASENEAIGTVISEFGNLDEVAQALGIEDAINPPHPQSQRGGCSAPTRLRPTSLTAGGCSIRQPTVSPRVLTAGLPRTFCHSFGRRLPVYISSGAF